MKNLLKFVGVLVLAFIGYVAYMLMNPVSPKDTVGYSSDNINFEVVYSRPYKNGRLIFGTEKEGALVPFGKYWRTGANAATSFETSSNISFNGQKLNAGKYSLYTVPGDKMWTVLLGSKSDVFFAVSEPSRDNIVLKTDVPVQTLDKPIEQFTIGFSKDSLGVSLDLTWDKTALSIPLE